MLHPNLLLVPYAARRLLLAAAAAVGLLAGAGSPARAAPLTKPTWLDGVRLTQYWPAPESWFHGLLVAAPGLTGLHRIDWLYSARGVTMEGEGIGLDGRYYHVDRVGRAGWVSADGRRASLSGGGVYWRAGGYWRNPLGAVTFPLDDGSWSAGPGLGYVPLPGVTFAPGPSLPLTPWESIAVDRRLIRSGSWVYLPTYQNGPGHGWFYAQDTGGGIRGRHIDIFRLPPADAGTPGTTLTSQRAYVLPPSQPLSQMATGAPGGAPNQRLQQQPSGPPSAAPASAPR